MIRIIVLAVFILLTGCTSNSDMSAKQVAPEPTKSNVQAHVNKHNATQTTNSTQASSTATSRTGNSSFKAKGIPSDFWDLIKSPTENPVNQTPTNNTPEKVPAPTDTADQGQGDTTNSSIFAQQVLNLVNQERSKAGLGSLSMDEELSKMAMVKAEDMYNNNYFDHNSPTYGSPFDMMKEFGISFNAAGENIAKGQSTPTQVMKDWMNSPGHKANILNKSYTHIGIAYYNNAWVQEFTG
ncbi:putative YkwD family protein [Paenibacillus anaericanus]|uniref:CAP domain-containing protein n=1 Tax=Paenibacillus anaericanus TaxID=170367 RepID=UPI002780C344|nr:CAP domain-containing protein [Paenibacillus anaericanus]MDQ0089020.1 putative YkwD family protein [Paenibacillus anaericanus]